MNCSPLPAPSKISVRDHPWGDGNARFVVRVAKLSEAALTAVPHPRDEVQRLADALRAHRTSCTGYDALWEAKTRMGELGYTFTIYLFSLN